MNQTNWYVLTGGPSVGKTTVLNEIKQRGYSVQPETARLIIETDLGKGLTLEQIRKDEVEFQNRVLKMKIEIENGLVPDQTIFFDRAIPDTIAYFRFLGLPVEDYLQEEMRQRKYKKIFLLSPLPYATDHVRIETPAEAEAIHNLLWSAYNDLGFDVLTVPVLPPNERADFILSNL